MELPDSIKKHKLLNYLIRIDFDLTGLCNRQCSFCPRVDPEVYPNVNKQISLDTIRIVLDELKQINYRGAIELAGRGESTLHKQFNDIVEMLSPPNKTWLVRLTTNGHRINKWWPDVSPRLDEMILNSYDSKKEYLERMEKYKQLPNGKLIEHHWKPDGMTIKEINKLPAHIDTVSGKRFVYSFNNRAGFFSDKVTKSPCWHPMRQIFIDYNGNYQMCCNDWKYQIIIGNVHERSLLDMYVNDPKLNRIRHSLINGSRDAIKPCSMCDDIMGSHENTKRIIQRFKQTKEYKHHVNKIAGNAGVAYKKQLREEGK